MPDWSAVVVEFNKEYQACAELERFGLTPYLPQYRRRWIPPRTRTFLLRKFPLFPRYLLLPSDQTSSPYIFNAQGVRKNMPVLRAQDGAPWVCRHEIIDEIMKLEASKSFDETLSRGDAVRISSGALMGVSALLSSADGRRAEIADFPMLGGCRVHVRQDQLRRA